MNRASMMMMEGERAGRVRWREVEKKRWRKMGPIIWTRGDHKTVVGRKASDVDEASRWLCSQQQLFNPIRAFWDTQLLPTTHVIIKITTPNNASTQRVTLA